MSYTFAVSLSFGQHLWVRNTRARLVQRSKSPVAIWAFCRGSGRGVQQSNRPNASTTVVSWLFLDMVLSGYVPDPFPLNEVLSACVELELLSLGQQLNS